MAVRDVQISPEMLDEAPVTVASLRLSASEEGLLAMLRHMLQEAPSAQLRGWEAALTIATARWPERAGAILLALSEMVKALAKARSGPIRAADPLDLDARAFASPEEVSLLRMMRAMRQDVTAEARLHLTALTGGRVDPMLVRAALSLARAMPALETGSVATSETRHLRLVH